MSIVETLILFPSSTSLSSGWYWLGVIVDDWFTLYFDTGTTDYSAATDDTYSDGLSDSFGSVNYWNAYNVSIYATYTTS